MSKKTANQFDKLGVRNVDAEGTILQQDCNPTEPFVVLGEGHKSAPMKVSRNLSYAQIIEGAREQKLEMLSFESAKSPKSVKFETVQF